MEKEKKNPAQQPFNQAQEPVIILSLSPSMFHIKGMSTTPTRISPCHPPAPLPYNDDPTDDEAEGLIHAGGTLSSLAMGKASRFPSLDDPALARPGAVNLWLPIPETPHTLERDRKKAPIETAAEQSN